MTTRSTRRSANVVAVQDSLTSLESLILAQAVWEHGANAWQTVSKILAKHPLISRPKSFFTTQSSHLMYNNLMKEAGLECVEENNVAHAPLNQKLAEKFYKTRLEELRTLILDEENKFKSIVAEMNAIRSGRSEYQPSETSLPSGGPLQAPSDEGFNGSDLTETPTPPKQLIPEEAQPTDVVAGVDNSPTPEPPSYVVDKTTAAEAPEADEDALALFDAGNEMEKAERSEISQRRTEEDEEQDRQIQGKPPEEEEEEEGAGEFNEQIASELPSGEPSPKPPIAEEVSAEAITNTQEVIETYETAANAPEQTDVAEAETSEPAMHYQSCPESQDIHAEDQLSVKSATETEEAQSGVMKLEDQEPSEVIRRRDGKRKASFVEVADSPRERKRARDDSEPVEEDDSGPSGATRGRRRVDRPGDQAYSKRNQNVLGIVHSLISQHRNGNIFHNPIKKSDAPDYHDIVKRPMDLKTIKFKIKDGAIATSSEFQRDIFLMFANAMMYNRPGSDVHSMAEDMMLESEEHINTFRQTEGFNSRI